MSITTEVTRIVFAGDGSDQNPYAIAFPLRDDDSVEVIYVTDSTGAEAVKVEGIDYTIAIAADFGSADLTVLTDFPATGETLLIRRNEPATRLSNYSNFDGQPSGVTNSDYDKSTMADQTLQEQLDRTIAVAKGHPDADLPLTPLNLIGAATKIVTVKSDESDFELLANGILDGSIAPAKLLDGSADNQVIQYNSGLGEWEYRINLTVPGTLAVAGATTLTGIVTAGALSTVITTANGLLVAAAIEPSIAGIGLSLVAGVLDVTWTVPGTIGSGTPNTGAFTTLSTSGLATLESVNVTNDLSVAVGDIHAVLGDLYTSEHLFHEGDANTFIRFANDRIEINAGGVEFITVIEDATDILEVNVDEVDVDFIVNALSIPSAIFVDGANGNVTMAKLLTVNSNTDGATILGRTRIDSRVTDEMYVSHFDMVASTDYALRQQSNGTTSLNAPAASSVLLALGNVTKLSVSAAGVTVNPDDFIVAAGDINVTLGDITIAAGDFEVTAGVAGFGVAGDATNVFFVSLPGTGERALFLKNVIAATEPVMEIRQNHTSGAVPCLELDQDDISEGFVDFVGTDPGTASTAATDIQNTVRVEINGVIKRLALYVDV